MRTVRASRGFTAYPNGTKTHFRAGDPREVSNALAEMLEAKRLVSVEAEDEGRRRKPAADETGSEETPTTDPETAE